MRVPPQTCLQRPLLSDWSDIWEEHISHIKTCSSTPQTHFICELLITSSPKILRARKRFSCPAFLEENLNTVLLYALLQLLKMCFFLFRCPYLPGPAVRAGVLSCHHPAQRRRNQRKAASTGWDQVCEESTVSHIFYLFLVKRD